MMSWCILPWCVNAPLAQCHFFALEILYKRSNNEFFKLLKSMEFNSTFSESQSWLQNLDTPRHTSISISTTMWSWIRHQSIWANPCGQKMSNQAHHSLFIAAAHEWKVCRVWGVGWLLYIHISCIFSIACSKHGFCIAAWGTSEMSNTERHMSRYWRDFD